MAEAKSTVLFVASILSLIQSAIWISASVTAVLVYLCEIEIAPYEDVSDFFRVTLIKLYFEGKQCTLNGSYLGKFNLEYNDPDKISLLTPDIVFAAMVVYVILHSCQFFLSISLLKSNKRKNEEKLLITVLNWGVLSIGISAVDLFLSLEFVWDMLKLTDYMKNDHEVYSKENNIKGIEYIPLILALASSRLIVFWLWNVCIAAFYFLCGICCNKVLGVRKERKIVEPPAKTTCHDSQKPSAHTIPSRQQPSDVNKVVGILHAVKDAEENKEVEDKKVAWNPSKPIYQHGEGTSEERGGKEDFHLKMVNEGFVNDNDEPVFLGKDKDADFAHRLENFDQDQKKVKIQKPPLGKFVESPVVPVAVGPENDSYNC